MFKLYRAKVAGFHNFMFIAYVSGLFVGTIAFFIPEHSGKLLAIWAIPFFIISFKDTKKFKELEYK